MRQLNRGCGSSGEVPNGRARTMDRPPIMDSPMSLAAARRSSRCRAAIWAVVATRATQRMLTVPTTCVELKTGTAIARSPSPRFCLELSDLPAKAVSRVPYPWARVCSMMRSTRARSEATSFPLRLLFLRFERTAALCSSLLNATNARPWALWSIGIRSPISSRLRWIGANGLLVSQISMQSRRGTARSDGHRIFEQSLSRTGEAARTRASVRAT